MTDIVKALIYAAAALVFAGVLYLQSEKYFLHQAVNSCMAAAVKTERINEWIETKVPIENQYQACMKEKGYE